MSVIKYAISNLQSALAITKIMKTMNPNLTSIEVSWSVYDALLAEHKSNGKVINYEPQSLGPSNFIRVLRINDVAIFPKTGN